MTRPEPLRLQHTFGSVKRSGVWVAPARIELRQRMGSTELDFLQATFEADAMVLEVDMIGGSLELRVPADLRVLSVMTTKWGSFEDHRRPRPEDGARSLTLSGRALWGSVEVRGPRK